MGSDQTGRTFISYSRKDAADTAAWLRTWLEARDLSVWQDIVALEGGRDWWSQIEEALRSPQLQHFILIVTLAVLESSVVRDEIRLARQQGKTVCPVIKGLGLTDLGHLPRWLGQVYDLDLTEHQTTLIRVLQGASRPLRVQFRAPKLPEDFVQRPKEFDAIKKRLLDPKGDAVAGISAALRGAGGYGKTTLALALAHDPDIQEAYFDEILWIALGETPNQVLSIVLDQIATLTGNRPGLETLNVAAAEFAAALGNRSILIVVDDVWREGDLKPFLEGGPHCARLVTTRIDSVLPQTVLRQPVDAMQAAEALSLLSAGLPADQVAHERTNLGNLAARLGEWAQLLKLVNGFMRNLVLTAHEPLSAAMADFGDQLDDEGPFGFDPRDNKDRARALARTIDLSLDLLSEPERARFSELAVFPEDAEIPVDVISRFWAEAAGLKEYKTKALLGRLFDLSLLFSLDLHVGKRVARLHDTIRHFLMDRAGKDGLVTLHKQLAAALDGIETAECDARARHYYYLYLLHHLAEAKERERLDALLLDPAWLKAKLEATANPQVLVADYQRYGVGEAQRLIGRTLRLISGICARDGRQLLPQLIGRLGGCEPVAASGFLNYARALLPRPAIVPLRPSLTQPGAEIARLEGHSHRVKALRLMPDGLLASASWDMTIRLWDVTTGESTPLEGHSGPVGALCVLPDDGRLASGSFDGTIRLWDATTKVETRRIEGDATGIDALCVLPGGRLASSARSGTIQLWDVATGTEIDRLDGHERRVPALCTLTDGRLASASDDRTIMIWNWMAGREAVLLAGHVDDINALCPMPHARLASASDDGTIRLWNTITGAEIARFVRAERVKALCLLSDGSLAAGSYNTIRIFNIESNVETARLEGDFTQVESLCVLPNGRLASGSWDGTIRLWDVSAGVLAAWPERPSRARPEAGSYNLCALPGDRLASVSKGKTIQITEGTTGAETTRLEGHTGDISALCALSDGRLASGSDDRTIRLWDVTTGAETACLSGHNGGVDALSLLSDGRLASHSYDGTIRLWDVRIGIETARLMEQNKRLDGFWLLADGRLASLSSDGVIILCNIATGRLEGHWDRVRTLCLLSDGRLAFSLWTESTIRLWDVSAGADTACLEGHADLVTALSPLAGGRLASGSSDRTIRLWDVATVSEVARLELDAPVTALIAVAPDRIVADDALGRLHWLQVTD